MGRWVMRSEWESAHNPSYRWHRCGYCGSAASITANEPAHRVGTCLLCGSAQCNDHADCQVCHFGWLPGWSGHSGQCQRAKCCEPAIGTARKRNLCRSHLEAVTVTGFGTRLSVAEYVGRSVAHRDSGKGWQQWMEVA